MNGLSLITDGMIGTGEIPADITYNIIYPLDLDMNVSKKKLDLTPIRKSIELNIRRD